MASSKMIDRTTARLRELDLEIAKRLLAAALLLQAEHKRDLSKANPAPHRHSSKPGEYPRARTYNLRDAVEVEPRSPAGIADNGLKVRVGYLKSAEYILELTKKNRKNVEDTAQRIKGRLRAIIGS